MEVYGAILENVMNERGAQAEEQEEEQQEEEEEENLALQPEDVQADNRAMLELLRSAQTGVHKEVVEALGQVGRAPLLLHISIC